MSIDKPQKRALVTGAAGGLGREVALQLAARGTVLGLADLNAAGLQETGRMVVDLGAEAEVIQGDFTHDGIPESTVQRVVNRWGGIDILVNNAAYGVIEPFLDSTYAAWTRTISRAWPARTTRSLTACATRLEHSTSGWTTNSGWS